MSDQIDNLTTGVAERLYHALTAIIDRARSGFNVTVVAATLYHADDADPLSDHELAMLDLALGLDSGTLESLLKAADHEDGAFIADGLGSFFLAVVALAASAVGHALNANDAGAARVRDDAVRTLRDAFFADTTRALRETAERMLDALGSHESRALQLRRVIGTSPGQAAMLDVMRDTLFAYLHAPKRLVPASRLNGRRVPPSYVRDVDVKALLDRTRGYLSAPQRAMLAKALDSKLTAIDVEALLDRHAKKLAEHRAKIAAGHMTHALAETAKLTGWRIAQRFGVLPRDQRRYWRTAGDERVRHSHATVPGMNPHGVALDKPFATPLGDTMHPPLEINCRCKAVLRRPA